jgi:hypothetical protein
MTVIDNLVTLLIIVILGFLIFSKINQKRPGAIPKIKEWFKRRSLPKPPLQKLDEHRQQTWEEKRTVM